MTKVLKALLIGVFLLVILLFAYSKYRTYKATKTMIPANAAVLLKVNSDELIKSVLLNVPLNPGYYFNSTKKRKKTKKASLLDALKIPASLFFYTMKPYKESTVFGRFELADYEEFKNYINEQKSLKPVNGVDGELSWTSSKDKKLSICYNKKSVVVCYSLKAENVAQAMADVLNEKDFIPADQSKFSQIMDSKAHVVFGNQQFLGAIDFINGAILSELTFTTDKLVPSEKPQHQQFNTNSFASFWMDASLKKIANEVFTFKDFKLESDSLLNYYKGYSAFEWTGVGVEKDSVVTYEYNDDFEKEETVTVTERKIPAFNVAISADVNGLKNYLSKQNLLDTLNGKINAKAFPLYQLSTSADDETFIAGTKTPTNFNSTATSSSDFMHLHLDLKKIKTEFPIPFISSYLNVLDVLDFNGKKENRILINGKVSFTNLEINSFYQLMKQF